jgi:hypothetical protein
MASTLITLAVLAALTVSANVLTRARQVHAIAPVAVAIVCAGLLVSAALVRPHPYSSPQVLPHYVMPYPPAGAGGPAAGACAGPYVPVGPATERLPSVVGATREPPLQIDALPGAPASVVLSSQFPGAAPTAAATVGSALSDLDLFHYVLATDPRELFFRVEIGTPRAGACAQQLVDSALAGPAGTRPLRITMLAPGPALAQHHATLACATSVNGVLEGCAWASTIDVPRRVFGVMWMSPTYVSSSNAQIGALADAVFNAVDG